MLAAARAFSFLSWLIFLPILLQAQGAPGAVEERVVTWFSPATGLTVSARKTLDSHTGAPGVWAASAHGEAVNLRALARQERLFAKGPGGRIDRLLAREMAVWGDAPFAVAIWLRFNPADVDFRSQLVSRVASGATWEEARAAVRALVAQGNLGVIEPARAMLEGLGLPLIHADTYAPVVVTVADRMAIQRLAANPMVDRIYPTLKGQPTLQSAVRTHRWDRVFDFGIRGDGVKIAILEDGGVSANGTGINVVGWLNPGQNIIPHPTIVAACAASDHATYPGHARGAEILSGNFLANPTWAAMMNAASWAINQGAEVLNMSFGGDSGLQLTVLDRYFDYQVRYNTVTIAVAAGNNGAVTASGNVIWPGLGWNMITVGNINDHANADWSDDTVAHDSSYKNPTSTHGDREKPEISAIGSDILAVGPGGTLWNSSGTSDAAPNIAGMAACLMQARAELTASPEAMKAILMAAAAHNVEGSSRLSDRDGAGCINGLQAYRMVEQHQYTFGTLYQGSFNNNGFFTYNVQLKGGDNTRIVVSWDSNANASYTSDLLDADLDLAVLQGQGVTVGAPLSASSSWDNNFEIVEFCPPTSGWYTIRVQDFRFDGTSEPYGMAWTQDQDGRYTFFRPHQPDVTLNDLTGPVIGNADVRLDPRDAVNPGKAYFCIPSLGIATGVPVASCRLFPLDLDLLSLMSVLPNPFFLDFSGTLDGSGAAPLVRVSLPDDIGLVGAPFWMGMVTLDGASPGGVKEIAVPKQMVIESHSDVATLGDDDFVGINIPFAFPFFGNVYTHCFLNSNGNITFNGGDQAYGETVGAFLAGLPRIAPFWDDLNPAAGGVIRARSGGDRLIIEWVDVPEYGATSQNSVIVVLYQDGRIAFRYRDCALQDAIVGISPGGGAAPYPVDISHGFRRPTNPGTPPAIFEAFPGASSPFDLGVASDRRHIVLFTPENGVYRLTVDLH